MIIAPVPVDSHDIFTSHTSLGVALEVEGHLKISMIGGFLIWNLLNIHQWNDGIE